MISFSGRYGAQVIPASDAAEFASRCAVLAVVIVMMIANSAPAIAQNLLSSEPTGVQYPASQYYLGLQAYREGELDTAAELFEAALNRARIDVHGRWVDSIPALAMLAECHWQLGSLPTAREHLDHAYKIAIRSRGWLSRVDWPGLANPLVRPTPAYLWPQARQVKVLPIQRAVRYQAGQPLTEARIARGGVIEEPSIRAIDVTEIMRCLAIAGYRRQIILGPLATDDPLAAQMLESIRYPANLQIPIARSTIGCMRASGYFASGDLGRARENASSSVSISGGHHPLSPITRLIQASTLADTDKVNREVAGLLATANIAAAMEQPEWIGETLQLAAGYCDGQSAAEVLQLATVIAPALRRRSRLASWHCLIAGADAAVTSGNLGAADKLLAQARQLSNRRNSEIPRLQAYAAYVAARLAAASGSFLGVKNPTTVDQALAEVNQFVRNHRFRNQPLVSMPRIYQMNLVQQRIGESVGNRTALDLLDSYCGDPPIEVYRRDPVDALAGIMADRSVLHAARVNLLAGQNLGAPFLVAANAMLTERFNASLALGGRVNQIRFLARADDSMLAPDTIVQRDQITSLINPLRQLVVANVEPNGDQIATMESAACTIALSRVNIPKVMPPGLNARSPVARLPDRTGLLTFLLVGNKMYGSLASGGKIEQWEIPGAARLSSEVGRLLRGLGVGKARGSRLGDPTWRSSGRMLWKHLIQDDANFPADRFDHLIVVPDGALWYAPFELLSLTDDPESPLIGDRMTISYAPTPGLALMPTVSKNVAAACGIATGPLFAPRDPELNQAVIQSIADVTKDPVVITAPANKFTKSQSATLPPSGMLGPRLGHFVVAAPRNASNKDLFTTALSPHDGNSTQGTLAGWLRFPANVPRSVVLIGLRTPVDNGNLGSGQELFGTMCALRSAGVNNVVLSRWAVGGESTAVLLRELLQELPYFGVIDAMNRSKMVLRRTELDPLAEPTLGNIDRQAEGLTGDHPFFWAGYMVSTSLAAPPPSPENE